MNNKERYQRAISPLHASKDFLTEVQPMKQTHHSLRRWLTLCAAVITLLAMATVCYAADVGGIRQIVQIWLLGEEKNATFEIEDGRYTLTDEDGVALFSGSARAIGNDGSERPLSEEEILTYFVNIPDVMYYDDDTVWLYYQDQKIDITDQFDENGLCYQKVGNLYFTIKYENGFSTSPDDYPDPDTFNTEVPESSPYRFPASEK